jgi:DegV family protein with EDD domain
MIYIITDSTCEGPQELFANPRVRVVSLYVQFGQQSLRDHSEISTAEFWERLPRARPLPTTSQATPGDFLEPFEQCTANGDKVVAIVLSSKLSGTYDSARLAQAGLPDRGIDVVDSLTISIGLGLMVQKAVAMAEAGATREQIVAKMLAMRDKIHILFALETLEYIQKGGRIGPAQAFVGTLLQFKPLLGLKDGLVYAVTRVRSKRKALDTLLEHLEREVPERGPRVKLGIVHACAEAEAQEMAQRMMQRFASPHAFIGMLGPVIGVHVGPGTVGGAVYDDGDDADGKRVF